MTAVAEVPADVRPVLAPVDAPGQYAEYMASVGRSDTLACETFWPEAALLCWKRGSGTWVTREDVREWGTSHDAMLARAAEHAATTFRAGWTEMRVEGIEGAYWMAPDPGGWAHAAVLDTAGLREVVGSSVVYVSAPVEGVLLAWAPGHTELNHAIAVGVHKMYDTESGPVTPVVFRYTGRWTAFVEAKPQQD